MPLADYTANLRFAHFFDTLDQNFPVSSVTRANPGSATNPTIAGTTDKYGDFSGSNGLSFTPASTAFFNVGTGDFSIICLARIDTAQSQDELYSLFNGGGGTSAVGLRNESAAGLTLSFFDPNSDSFRTESGNNAFVAGQDFIACARRASNVTSLWVDTDGTGGMSDQTNAGANAFGGRNLTQANNCYIGAGSGGANATDGRVYWLIAIAQAVTTTDLADGALWNESALKSAFGLGGGGGTTPLTRPSRAMSGGMGPQLNGGMNAMARVNRRIILPPWHRPARPELRA